MSFFAQLMVEQGLDCDFDPDCDRELNLDPSDGADIDADDRDDAEMAELASWFRACRGAGHRPDQDRHPAAPGDDAGEASME